MELSTAEQMLIEQRVTNESKSVFAAYCLLVFLGLLGMHRFYLGRHKTGWAMIALTALGLATMLLLPAVIWIIVDLFLIPGMVKQYKDDVREKMRKQLAKA